MICSPPTPSHIPMLAPIRDIAVEKSFLARDVVCTGTLYSRELVKEKLILYIILINKVERDEGRVLEGLHGVEEDGVDVGEGAGWGALALLS